MHIEFRCQYCNRRLSVKGRKAGHTVGCPKCGRPSIVPALNPAPAHERRTEPSTTPQPVLVGQSASGGMVFDDVESLISDPIETPTYRIDDAPPFDATLPEAVVHGHEPEEEDWREVVGWLVLQAAVLLGVAVGAFLLGYYVGQSRSAPAKAESADKPASDEAVVLWGRVHYRDHNGRAAPDRRALVLVLPADFAGDPSLESSVLWAVETGGNALKQMGGAAQHTVNDGSFTLRLEKPGRYHLFVISGGARRAPGERIDREPIDILAKYVIDPMRLVESRRVKHVVQNFEGSPPRFEFDFGAAG